MCDLIGATSENILEKTKSFLVKAQESLEKPKDVPRYKAVLEYEGEFKESYRIGLKSAFVSVVKKYNKLVKENDFTASSDSGAS